MHGIIPTKNAGADDQFVADSSRTKSSLQGEKKQSEALTFKKKEFFDAEMYHEESLAAEKNSDKKEIKRTHTTVENHGVSGRHSPSRELLVFEVSRLVLSKGGATTLSY